MTKPQVGNVPPQAAAAASPAAGRMPAAVHQDYVTLGYRLGAMRENLNTLVQTAKVDHDIVPWTIVPPVYGILWTKENDSLCRTKQKEGADWVRKFARLLDLVDQQLPRGEQSQPSESFLKTMREVGQMLRSEPGAKLLRSVLFQQAALPILEKLSADG